MKFRTKAPIQLTAASNYLLQSWNRGEATLLDPGTVPEGSLCQSGRIPLSAYH